MIQKAYKYVDDGYFSSIFKDTPLSMAYPIGKSITPRIPGTPMFLFKTVYSLLNYSYNPKENDIIVCEYDDEKDLFPAQKYMAHFCTVANRDFYKEMIDTQQENGCNILSDFWENIIEFERSIKDEKLEKFSLTHNYDLTLFYNRYGFKINHVLQDTILLSRINTVSFIDEEELIKIKRSYNNLLL